MTDTVLDPHRRGDTFVYSASLASGWVVADFTGSFKFTLRKRLPATSVTADTDSGVIDQADIGVEISATGANFTITIPKERSTTWPTGTLYWDLQGVVSSTGYCKTIDGGTIVITPDITRSF